MNLLKKTNFIDLYRVSQHAYGAISNNPLTMSNAGFVDLGDKVVIFDTFLSLEASAELKALVYEYTNPRQIIVVNSHGHLDHILGNSVYEDCIIISSRKTYDALKQSENDIEFGEKYQKDIDYLTKKLNEVEDFEEKKETSNSLIIVTNLRNELNQFVLPNLIIDKDITIVGTDASFTLHVLEKGHSDGDILGFIQDEKVSFAGDLIFAQRHPYFGVGDPKLIIEELNRLYHEDIDYFIPGHGPICRKDELLNQIEYIEDLTELVKRNLFHPEKITVNDLKEKYHHQYSVPFRWNINFLVEYLKNNS